MEPWIAFTLAAAFFQNLRSAMQKHLQGKLSTLGAAYVRFVYALPVAALYFICVIYFTGQPLPHPPPQFLLYVLLGGICQIMFTVFLLWLFSFHNFAVGTTFSKLETIMVAVFGLLLLGDRITPAVTFAIVLSASGVLALSAGQSKLSWSRLSAGLWRVPTLIGLACAAWLGASVVFFRGASLSLHLGNFQLAASCTLLVALLLQTAIMGAFMALRRKSELKQVFLQWRFASLVGISGGLASIGWFAAFTLQNATYVRALGQVELIFTYIATVMVFKEKMTRAELVGIGLIAAGIMILLMAG